MTGRTALAGLVLAVVAESCSVGLVASSAVAGVSAALRRISAVRLRFYDRAAASPGDGTWSGQSLDRVMADADTRGMALIQATAPMVVTLALTVGGFVVIAVAGYPQTAVIVAVATAVLTAIRRLLPHAVLVLAMHEVPAAASAWITVSLD